MATTLSDIGTKLRYLIEDTITSQVPGDIFTYTSSLIFTLTENNVISIISVLRNSIELGSGDYSYDSTTNKVTISTALISGDSIEIRYTYYPNYSNTELKNYIQSALIHLSINNYYTFTVDPIDDEIYPDPTIEEQNLITIISSILINKTMTALRLPDLSLNFPSDLNVSEKITKTIALFKANKHGIFARIGG